MHESFLMVTEPEKKPTVDQIVSNFMMTEYMDGYKETLHDFMLAFFVQSDWLSDEERQLVATRYISLNRLLDDLKKLEGKQKNA
jgi:hypothetical protein